MVHQKRQVLLPPPATCASPWTLDCDTDTKVNMNWPTTDAATWAADAKDPMTARINSVDGVAVAVGIRRLIQVGVAGDEAPDLRVVEPAPH